MIIKSIKARNFMQYDELNIKDIPPKGVIGIFGNNELGKSTIGEAISFALFGVTTKAPKGEKDKIISWNGANSCFVEMVFKVNNREYSIYRKIRRKGSPEVKLIDLKLNKILGVGTKATDAEISRILGFGFKEFRYSTYVAQKELRLIQDKKQDRKEVIDKLLGILDLEEARKSSRKIKRELNEKESDIKRLFDEKLREKQDLDEKVKHHTSLTNEIDKLSKSLERKRVEFESVKVNLENLLTYKKINDDIRNKERVKEEKRKTVETIKSNLEEISKNEKEILLLEDRLKQDEFVKIEEKYKLKKETENLLRHFKRDLEKVKDLYLSLKQDINSEVTSLREQLKNVLEDIQTSEGEYKDVISIHVNENELNELERKKKDAKSNLKNNFIITLVLCIATIFLSLFHSIGMVLILPVLFFIYKTFLAYKYMSSVESEIEDKRQEIHDLKFKKRRISEIKKKLEVLKNKKQDLEKNLEEKRKLYHILDSLHFTTFQEISKSLDFLDVREYPILEKLKTSLSDITNKYPDLITINETIDLFEEKLKKEIEDLNEKLMEKKKILERIKVLKKNIKSKERLETDLSKLFEEIKDIDQKIINLRTKLPDVKYSEEELKYTEKRKDELDKEIREIEGNIKDYRGQLKSIESDLKKLPKVKEELSKLEKELYEIGWEIKVYNELESVFKETSDNIRKRLGPQIESYFSWILPKITNNRYKKVRMDSDFNIQVFSEEKHDYVDLSVLSGGTVDQLLISLRLAFAKALTPESGEYSTQFLFLDEPLSSFDPDRRSSFLEFIRSLESTFQQIFIISHLSGLENYVDNHIRIRLDSDGKSKVIYTWE